MPPPEMPMEKGEYYSETDILMGSEIQAALEGHYQAATRISSGGQVSVTLYTAIPVRDKENIIGAVLVSQSTYRILQDLYELRLNIFKIFAVSILIAFAISFFLSLTISRPLKKLQRQALQIMDSRGRLTAHFQPSKIRDEIGDLGNSLHYLTKQVNKHIQFIESFSSDVSHEFRNPLASIRSASELLAEAGKREDQDKFAEMIRKDIRRLEGLLADVREISCIDTRLEEDQKERISICSFLTAYIENFKNRYPEKCLKINVECKEGYLSVEIAEIRLYQVFDNLIGNAAEFSPENGTITISLTEGSGRIHISIADNGPGIADNEKEKIFERFYSGRKDENKHSGLGLSIVQAIIQGLGGSISVRDNKPSGCIFSLEFPIK